MPAEPPHSPRTRRRRWLLVALGAGAVGLVLVAAALPSLVGSRFVGGKILARINQTLAPGRLDVDRFEVSWTRATRLIGCRLIAPDGVPVVESAVVELDRSLGALCWNRGRALSLTLDRATLKIERQANGQINLGAALQAVIAHPDPSRDLTIRMKGGALSVGSEGGAAPWIVGTTDLELHIPPSPRAMTWDLQVCQAEGSLTVKGETNRWTARDQNPGLADLRLDLGARAWPIQLASDGLTTRGRLEGTLAIDRRSERWSLDATTRLLDLSVTGSRLLGDTLAPGPVAVACDVSQTATGWSLRRLTIDSSLGSLRGEGRLDPGLRSLASTGQPHRIEGRIDLAALAKQLPRTLRLRPGLVVEGGSARLLAEASGPVDRALFHLEATVADLQAQDGARRLSLREPATMMADVLRVGNDVTIQQLSARTAFLNATASGRLDDGTLTGSVDFGALRRQLGEWVDLGRFDGAGRADFDGTYQVRDQHYQAHLQAKGHDLRLVGLTSTPIDRPLATIDLTVQGQPTATGWPSGWDSAELTAGSGASSARIAAQTTGASTAIQARLAAELSGANEGRRAEASLVGSWSEAQRLLRCDRIEARLLPQAGNQGDPFGLVARGEYDGVAGTVQVEPISGPRSSPTAIRLAPQGIRITGLGADLASIRVAAAFQGDLPSMSPTEATAGNPWLATLTAQGNPSGVEFSARADLRSTGKGDRIGDRPDSLLVLGQYTRTNDRIELTECRVDSAFGGLAAAGQLDDVSGARRFRIQGQIAPDFAALTAWMQRQVEPGARLTGRPRSFQVAGAWSGTDPSALVEGDFGLELGGADVYGIQLGPTPVVLRLRNGQILVDPISTTLNEGHIRLEPEVLWRDSQGDPVLRLGKNSSIRDARINDEVSRRVLAFVAPILEGATRASGRVSVDLDHAEIPLRSGRSKRAQVNGQVVFADVAFAPGPLANDLLGAIGRRDATLKLDRPVTLTIADGRINQSGLALPVGDLTRIELAGWVDFDRNLALTVTLPVTPAMLGNNPLLSDIAAGAQIRLPISGTLSRPMIDQDALAAGLKDLGRSLLTRGATRGALELLLRAGRPKDPNAPEAAPAPTAEERKALRQERRAERKAGRGATPGGSPNP